MSKKHILEKVKKYFFLNRFYGLCIDFYTIESIINVNSRKRDWWLRQFVPVFEKKRRPGQSSIKNIVSIKV